MDRRFVALDGEGWDRTLALLADSDGRTLHRRAGVSTQASLDFLLETPRDVNAVWYGFGWDVNMMLGDLPIRGERHSLEDLITNGRTSWRGYHLSYIPRKIFRVFTRREDGKVDRSFTSYDVLGFFGGSFVAACESWGVKLPKVIRTGKAGRGGFDAWPMDKLITYNAAEVIALVDLMDRLRDAIRRAGWSVSSWHGSGALASVWLRTHGTKKAIAAPAPTLARVAARAYFGGRIDAAAWGHAEGVHHYDINSAYPAAFADCPDLSKLTYVKRSPRGVDVAALPPFSLVSVRWSVSVPERPAPFWGPLPWRDHRGSILYPPRGAGWYYAVEVAAAMARGIEGARYKVVEVLVPHGDLVYPFDEQIRTDYAHRARLKKAGDPAHVPIKLALNSLYGKLAQKQSYDDRPPPYYSLLWAGFITAATRARISRAMGDGSTTLAVMTDGIFTSRALDVPVSGKLGSWSKDDRCSLDVAEPGVYSLTFDDGRVESYTRGYEPEAGLTAPAIVDRWESGDSACITYEVQRFVGMALAVGFPYRFRPAFRTFTTLRREFEPVWLVGTTKRVPWSPGARPTGHGLHWLAPRETPSTGLSWPYKAREIAETDVERMIDIAARETVDA